MTSLVAPDVTTAVQVPPSRPVSRWADARRTGALIEELTDREQSVLRALTTEASQREIGASLYLSINTVKGYTRRSTASSESPAVMTPSCGDAILA